MNENSRSLSDEHKSVEEDPRLIQAMEDYLAVLETGVRPDRQQFLKRYGDIAEELAANLDGIDFVHGVAPEMRNVELVSSRSKPRHPPDATLHPMATLGDYRILRELGRGGMGIVYEAEQLSLERRVALKVLPFAGVLDERTIKRFKNEARAAACLEHPHIVPVHAVCQDRGVHFFAMALIDGLTLAQVITDLRLQIEKGFPPSLDKLSIDQVVSRRYEPEFVSHARISSDAALQSDRLSQAQTQATLMDIHALISTKYPLFDGEYFRRIAEIGIQTAEALQHAHEHGIVHRDIKPGNLMIDGNRRLWVTDFGLAQFENDPGMTMTGDLLGTVRYMSPEQALGNRSQVNHSTDIYSLGVTLFELLALQPPFVGEHRAELLRRISNEEPSSPQRLNKAVPAELATIVLKAMHKSPQDRYATAADLAADLRCWLEHKAIKARPPSHWQRLSKWSRRNRPLVGALTAAVLFIVVATISVGWWQMDREAVSLKRQLEYERRSLAMERTLKQAEEKQRLRAEASELEATRQLYNADMRSGLADWKAGNIARLSARLLRHTPPSSREDLRGWEWFYLLSLCHEDQRTLNHRFGTQVLASISPDGRFIASAGVDTTIKIFETRSGEQVFTWISPNDGIAMAPSWSPDSQQLAWGTADEGEVYLLAIATQAITCLKGHASSVLAISWSPDGKHLASGGSDKCIRIWNASTHASRIAFEKAEGEFHSLCWHPSGSNIASVSGEDLLVVDASTGECKHNSDDANISQIAWSSDGDVLIVGTVSGECQVRETGAYSIQSKWKAHNGRINSMVVGHAQQTVFTAGSDHLIHAWNLTQGNCELTLRGHLNQVLSVSLDRSNHSVASSGLDGLVKLWALPHFGQPRSPMSISPVAPAASTNGIEEIFWSESGGVEGRLLGTAIEDEGQSTLVVLDAESGRRISTFPLTSAEIGRHEQFALSPNASMLATCVDGKLSISNLATGQVHFAYSKMLAIRSMAWSPDGNLLAVAGSGEVEDGANLSKAAWSSVFDVQKKERVHRFRHGSTRVEASAIAWSPDGKCLVSGDVNGLIEIRQVSSNRKLCSMSLHSATVNALAWSPDGKRIASGSDDQLVRIWDASTGEELATLDETPSAVRRLCWSRNGQQLAATTVAGELQVWDASKGYNFVTSDEYRTVRAQNSVSRAVQMLEEGKIDDAVALSREALQESITGFGEDHRETHWIMAKLALVLYDAGQEDEAKRLWTTLLEYSAEQRDDYSGVVNFVIRRANTATIAGRIDEAKSLFQILLQADVNDHYFLNKLAWELANSPDPSLRDPKRAVDLATRANQQKPTGAQILNTLGVAHYRAENWFAAIENLLKSEELTPNKRTSYNAFFLSMAYWQLHENNEAQKWFDLGARWMQSNKYSNELIRIHEEASEVLGNANGDGNNKDDGQGTLESP